VIQAIFPCNVFVSLNLEECGTIGHIMQRMEEAHMPLQAQPDTVARWLKDMGFNYKRYRASLKKRDPELVARFRLQLEEVMRRDVGQRLIAA
jgi:hypothetical protein